MSDPQGDPNRLVHETSPYLLQHAYNPVDWYPWGEEAFAAARELNRPIFLSVGYSACHWCHVMERESFEHPQIAAVMNQWFINIKVDREERPDIDQLYMTAVQLVSGQGGWPMSVFLTPDGKPFFGGTYWPPVSRQGMLGFGELLQRIHHHWETHQDECLSKGSEMADVIHQLQEQQQVKSVLNEDLLKNAENKILEAADWEFGGFGTAPKFPNPTDLKLLLRTWKRFNNEQALKFVTLTLDRMADGGIYDHLGGGFARYATDQRWLVPHFEKMLYDNAQLVLVYLEAYREIGNQRYREVVIETLDFILREMTDDSGAFYSTLDADSEGVEGKFYVWSQNEIEELLGDDAKLFNQFYDVTPSGNWEGHNILNRNEASAPFAAMNGLSITDWEAIQERCRSILLKEREQRVRPGRDEKILLSWNGLMLSAFAEAATALNENRYYEATRRAAKAINQKLKNTDGQLCHSYKDDRQQQVAFLDDYACYIESMLQAALACSEPEFLACAIEAAQVMVDQFYDRDAKRFYYTPLEHEKLITRVRDQFDNATPAGTNLAIYALYRLGQLTDQPEMTQIAVEALDESSGAMLHQPNGTCQALLALDRHLSSQGVYVGCVAAESELRNLKQQLWNNSSALDTIIVLSDPHDWETLVPLAAGKRPVDDQTTVYFCVQGRCEKPWVGEATIKQELS